MRSGFLDDVRRWGESDERIDAILLVGSYARGAATEKSDVDLILLTLRKEEFAASPCFIRQFGGVKDFSVEEWGACTSIRVYYGDVYYGDMEVEFGVVHPSWIGVPLDAGTRRVLSDGYQVILDKKHYFDSIRI